MNGKTTRRIFVTMAVGITVLYISIVFGCSQMKPQSGGSANPKRTLSKDQRMKWWREARFGMFIHWGLYAVPAGEWKGKRIPGIGEWIMERADIPV